VSLPKDYPPVVYLPCVDWVSDPADVRVEYRVTRDGRKALLVYSALDRLHAGVGEDQPWFVVPTANLQALWEREPFDLTLLDLAVPEDQRARSC
jgi:hypothetical protein